MQLHHHGFQPEMDGYAMGELVALRGFGEWGSAVSSHQLAMDHVRGLVAELGRWKHVPLNETLRWERARRRMLR